MIGEEVIAVYGDAGDGAELFEVHKLVRCRECKWFDSGKNDSEIWSMCTRHFGKYIDVNADDFCSYGSRSEKPNNCEHITEDGVTCARYPACDDCLDNPLNKVKGSERLVKGSEKPNNSERSE